MKAELIKRINHYLNKFELFRPQSNSDKDIKQAEEKLNVVFDPDYKQFIKLFGGCYVGVDVYGIKNSNDLEDKSIIDLTEEYKKSGWNIPKGSYVISFDSSGNPIMINNSGEIILFDHDNFSLIKLADSFEKLIEDNLPD